MTESTSNKLSAQDKARILLNTEELANRHISLANQKFPILHLGIGALERFRAVISPIEELYLKFCNSGESIIDFITVTRQECMQIFLSNVPRAAALVTGVPEQELKAFCEPLGLLCVVLSQWLHNAEIGRIRELFPHPDPEESDDDPNEGNPMTVIDRVASAYPWSYEAILKFTVPQLYLTGVSSAWAYEKIKNESDEPKSVSTRKTASPKANFKKMSAEEYKKFTQDTFAGVPAEIQGRIVGIFGN